MKNGTPLWREAHFQVKMHKTPQSRTNFGCSDVQKVFKNCTPLRREAHLQVKMHKTPQSRTNFGRSDVQKLHAAVARSTFASQNVQNTSLSEPFFFRWSKIARCCGAKHICKSKCEKTHGNGPLFALQMAKNSTRLWREVHF